MRQTLAALLLLVATASTGRAQEVLTLDRAVAEALAGNAGLRAARTAVPEADARAIEARSAFLPRVSVVDSWQRGNLPVFAFGSLLSARRFTAADFAVDRLNHPVPTGFFHAAFTVEQLVFDGGGARAASDAASYGRDVAALTADQAAADLALAAAQAYGRVLAADAARRSLEAAVTSAEEDAARAARRRDAGTATDADVLAFDVHLADVRQRSIQAAGEAAVARAELNRVLGRPIDADYAVQEPAMPPADAVDVASLLAEADAARPDLRRAERERQVAAAGVRAARAAWWPQVLAQAGYELNGTQFTDRSSGWLFGGAVRWTLSAGGAELARQRAAGAALTRADALRDDARSAAHVEIVAAARRLEAARAREAVGRTAVAQARESQRIIRDRYDSGLAGLNDVLRAATALLDAESQRTGAVVDVITSEAAVRHALGRP